MASKRTEQLLNWDREHVLHSIYHIGGELAGIVFERTDGITLTDTEGKEYIDLASQLTCCNLGHRQMEVVEAVVAALGRMDYTETYFGFTHPYIAECAHKLAGITPRGIGRFFFTSGGAEAIEFAIKFAQLYWYSRGKGSKYKIVSLRNAYHGSAGAAIAASGIGPLYTRGLGPTGVGFVKVPPAYCYHCSLGLSYPGCGIRCAGFLADIIDNEGADTVAAFIGEPVQGGGGVIDPPPEYWPLVKKACAEREVLFIGDEVQSGFCRTGKMWALEHWGVVPDIMTMAKGLSASVVPFGAVGISDGLFEAMKGHVLPGGYTYSGHPLGCAASIASIDVYIKDKVVENAARVGKHMRERLDREFAPLPAVGEVRGKGLFQAAELVSDRKTRAPLNPGVRAGLARKLLEAGIVTRLGGYGGGVIYFTPPCTATTQEVDRALDIVKPIVAGLG